MGFMQHVLLHLVLISSGIYCRNHSMNIFLVNDLENDLLSTKLEEAMEYMKRTYYVSVNAKKISADDQDPVSFLNKLCDEYEVSLKNQTMPHLVFDTTQSTIISKAVKFFTKALALPTVTTSSDAIGEDDAWNNLDRNEMQYLISVSPPLNSIIRMIKYIINRQKITNVAIVLDKTFDHEDIFPEIFQNLGIRNRVKQIESEESVNEELREFSRNFSNFLILGSLQHISCILKIAESEKLLHKNFAWYAVTLENGMANCSSCLDAEIIFIQPSTIYEVSHFTDDFYFHLLIESLVSLRKSYYVNSWNQEVFINCKTYDGNNTPSRENIDLELNFQRTMFHYKPLSMHVNLVHFSNGKIKDSVLVGQWDSYNGMKLINEHLWGEFVEKEMLKVIVVEQRPFLFMDESHPRGFNGYLIDMMEDIASMSGFDFYIKLASDNTIGDLDDEGNWNGLMRDILDSRADIGLASIPVTSVRDRVIDFTIPYYRPVGSIILMKLFRTETSLNKFIDVMEYEVWFCILAAFCATSLLIWIFDKYNTENNEKAFSLKESLWFCFLSMTPQGTGDLPSHISGRIIAVVWWLFSFIILASYTANLSAILTVSLLENPVENIHDLQKEFKIQYAPLNGSPTMQYFSRMMHIEEVFHNIWKNLTFDAENTEVEKTKFSVWTYPVSGIYTAIWKSMLSTGFPKTLDEALEKLRKSVSPTEGFVFLGDATDCRYLQMTNCDLQTIGEEFFSKPYAIALPEGSPLKKRLDLALVKLMKNRALDKLETKWWDKNPLRKKCGETENQFDGIGLRNIGGVFILILVGILSATFTLVVEFYWFKHNEQAEIMAITPKYGIKKKQ